MSSTEQPRKAPVIVCAGIAVIDYIFQLDHFPRPPDKSRARNFTIVSGGNCGNAAIAAARLGGQVRLSAPLGDDSIADTIVGRLQAEKVDCAHVVRMAGAHSPISSILVDGSGERMITNYRSDSLADARVRDAAQLVADAGAILIDNRFPEFSLDVAEAARRRGLPVLLDADEPTRLTDELLSRSTHVIFSAYGLRDTAQCDDAAEALLRIAGRTQAFLAVTGGEAGALWLDGRHVRQAPAFGVNAVDTLGAGDVYHGAFALALGEGRDLAWAMRFSAAAAAVKCTRFGGISGAPVRAEVEAFLASREAKSRLP